MAIKQVTVKVTARFIATAFSGSYCSIFKTYETINVIIDLKVKNVVLKRNDQSIRFTQDTKEHHIIIATLIKHKNCLI